MENSKQTKEETRRQKKFNQSMRKSIRQLLTNYTAQVQSKSKRTDEQDDKFIQAKINQLARFFDDHHIEPCFRDIISKQGLRPTKYDKYKMSLQGGLYIITIGRTDTEVTVKLGKSHCHAEGFLSRLYQYTGYQVSNTWLNILELISVDNMLWSKIQRIEKYARNYLIKLTGGTQIGQTDKFNISIEQYNNMQDHLDRLRVELKRMYGGLIQQFQRTEKIITDTTVPYHHVMMNRNSIDDSILQQSGVYFYNSGQNIDVKCRFIRAGCVKDQGFLERLTDHSGYQAYSKEDLIPDVQMLLITSPDKAHYAESLIKGIVQECDFLQIGNTERLECIGTDYIQCMKQIVSIWEERHSSLGYFVIINPDIQD